MKTFDHDIIIPIKEIGKGGLTKGKEYHVIERGDWLLKINDNEGNPCTFNRDFVNKYFTTKEMYKPMEEEDKRKYEIELMHEIAVSSREFKSELKIDYTDKEITLSDFGGEWELEDFITAIKRYDKERVEMINKRRKVRLPMLRSKLKDLL